MESKGKKYRGICSLHSDSEVGIDVAERLVS
jgi:hypothetical protein